MAIVCVGSDLYVSVSGGFSLKNTICDISARVCVWTLHVLLIIKGMIWTWSFFPVVSLYGLFEWFVYVVYVSYGVQSVVVRGVLKLYKLYASPSSGVCVFHKLSMPVSYVSNGSDDAWFVVFWSFMFR